MHGFGGAGLERGGIRGEAGSYQGEEGERAENLDLGRELKREPGKGIEEGKGAQKGELEKKAKIKRKSSERELEVNKG
ncbi:uncharacterized protein EAF01_001973 [Botrytis porri]|uniref:uncharacterized protein n=1 Tax=Botrytis porri TaxID=87229 RepID=UPI001901F89E|nr:uncharacterized protein EAF01_001973 [Botrytis porri]KAF7912952.1 hypothetical protein EAF01_001973 [Botrytis porri]